MSESNLYYFYTVGCGFCKKADPLVDELNNAIESAAKDVQKYFQHYDRRRQRLNIEDWSGDDLFAAPSKSTI